METVKGKVAVITGGNSGIGKAAAIAFAKAGARVVIAARGVERGEGVAHEIEAMGAEAIFVRADLSKAGDIEALFKIIMAKYGRLDYAFNNAATVAGGPALTTDFTEEQFDYMMSVNLKGVWLCMKYEIQQMLRQTPAGGAIVNTSSVSGLGGARQGAPYSASKAGVLALTKSAALEYAHRGIRVNALVVGAFGTPMLESAFERVSAGDPEVRKAMEKRSRQLSPMGRIGRPEEAGEVAVWLCSEASSYVTGHSMIVDGGMTAAIR